MRRSSSRDRVDRFNDLDHPGCRHRYYRGRNLLERARVWGAILMVLAAVGAVFAFSTYRPLDRYSTHGPLASVHAPWDASCDKCHRTDTGGGWLDAGAKWHDFGKDGATCLNCHGAGPHAERGLVRAEDPSLHDCGSCHHDHNGRDYSLVRLSDDHCTRCHADLKSNLPANHPPSRLLERGWDRVASLADHKPFLDKPQRESTLRFSHAQHMTPGMATWPKTDPKANTAHVWTVKDGKYEWADPNNLAGAKVVEMKCGDCHQPDASGREFQPIRYADHCNRCHETTTPAGWKVPHGLSAPETQEFILGEVTSRMLKDAPALDPAFQKGKPKKELTDPFAAQARAEGLKVFRATMNAETRNGCLKCHAGNTDTPVIERTNIPTRWFQTTVNGKTVPTAKFDHAAHRMVDCQSCHPGTEGAFKTEDRAAAWERERPHFVENVKASCIECHSPAGGVRHACTDCHEYHHGATPPLRPLNRHSDFNSKAR